MTEQNKTPETENVEVPAKKGGLMAWLRTNFFTGFIVLLPIAITIYLFQLIVISLDTFVLSMVPPQYHPSNFLSSLIPGDREIHVYGVGLLSGFLSLVFVGVLTKNFFGRVLLKWWERLVSSIPGVRAIYGSTKQVIDAITSTSSASFREVVMVEYPRPGLWAIAFVSGKTKGEVQSTSEEEMLNVFLPTTPNPTSGFLLFVPEKDVIKLNMTVDQGIKMVISAGIVTPTKAEGVKALKKQAKIKAEEKKMEEQAAKEGIVEIKESDES